MSEHERFSELLSQLMERFGPTLTFPEVARALRFPSVAAAYQARARKTFPVRVVDVAGVLRVSAADLARFLCDGQSQKVEGSAPPRRKPGRPRKIQEGESAK